MYLRYRHHNDTDRNGHATASPPTKEWISSLLIAASKETAVEVGGLAETLLAGASYVLSPARESGAETDSIFDSLRTQTSCRVETLAYECVCKCLCCVTTYA
jgi:hypothetical protein